MHLLIDAFKCHSRACLAISIIKIECVVEMQNEFRFFFIFIFLCLLSRICKRLEKMNDNERCFYCLLKIILWVWLVEWNEIKNTTQNCKRVGVMMIIFCLSEWWFAWCWIKSRWVLFEISIYKSYINLQQQKYQKKTQFMFRWL